MADLSPAAELELKRLAKRLAVSHAPTAIERLIDLIDHANPQVALAACAQLLDRGLGKPQQSIDVTADTSSPARALDIARLDEAEQVALWQLVAKAKAKALPAKAS